MRLSLPIHALSTLLFFFLSTTTLATPFPSDLQPRGGGDVYLPAATSWNVKGLRIIRIPKPQGLPEPAGEQKQNAREAVFNAVIKLDLWILDLSGMTNTQRYDVKQEALRIPQIVRHPGFITGWMDEESRFMFHTEPGVDVKVIEKALFPPPDTPEGEKKETHG